MVKDLHFLLKNLHFLLKNLDFDMKFTGNNLFIPPCGPQDQILTEANNDSITTFLNVRELNSCLNSSCNQPCRTLIDDAYQNAMHHPREDILRYTSEPMRVHTSILGNVTADLVVGCNTTDTDFVVMIQDVFPNGTAMYVQKGAVRMRWRGKNVTYKLQIIRSIYKNGGFLPNIDDLFIQFQGWDRFRTEPAAPMRPGEKYKINVAIGMVAYVINRGHSIRVTVAGSNWPYRLRTRFV